MDLSMSSLMIANMQQLLHGLCRISLLMNSDGVRQCLSVISACVDRCSRTLLTHWLRVVNAPMELDEKNSRLRRRAQRPWHLTYDTSADIFGKITGA